MATPTSITIWVADVIVTQREVQCPLECPHCGHDLTTTGGDGEIKLYHDTLDEASEHGAIEVDLDEPNLTHYELEGSDTVATLNVRCDKCHKSVLDAPGTLRNARPDGVVIS